MPSIRTRAAATHLASSVSRRSPPFPNCAAALFLCSFPSRRRPCSALDSAAAFMPPFPSLLLLHRGMDETEQPPTITTAPPLERRCRAPRSPRPRAPAPRHQPRPRPRPAAQMPQRCRAPTVPHDAKHRGAELRLRPRQEPRRHLFGATEPTLVPQTSVPASSDQASSLSAHSPAPSRPRRLRRPARRRADRGPELAAVTTLTANCDVARCSDYRVAPGRVRTWPAPPRGIVPSALSSLPRRQAHLIANAIAQGFTVEP